MWGIKVHDFWEHLPSQFSSTSHESNRDTVSLWHLAGHSPQRTHTYNSVHAGARYIQWTQSDTHSNAPHLCTHSYTCHHTPTSPHDYTSDTHRQTHTHTHKHTNEVEWDMGDVVTTRSGVTTSDNEQLLLALRDKAGREGSDKREREKWRDLEEGSMSPLRWVKARQ